MSERGYAQLLREIGHTVREHAGAHWYNVAPHVYGTFHAEAVFEPEDLNPGKILGADGWLLRYACPVEKGRPSYRIVCERVEGKEYGFESLASKARNQTRRGLENCDIRRLDFKELEQSGMKLNRETLERQGRKIPADLNDYWNRYYRAAAKAEGSQAWGAIINGELAAYIISFTMGRSSSVLIVKSSRELLNKYPNNALMFEFIKNALNVEGLAEVSIGFEAIQGDMESLDHFKIGMGFRQLEVGQRIEPAWWLKPFFAGPLLSTATKYAEKQQGENMKKLSGMLRWYKEQPKLK